MKNRYKHKNGDILDRACGTTGHTMFLVDVASQLNRIYPLEVQIADLRNRLKISQDGEEYGRIKYKELRAQIVRNTTERSANE